MISATEIAVGVESPTRTGRSVSFGSVWSGSIRRGRADRARLPGTSAGQIGRPARLSVRADAHHRSAGLPRRRYVGRGSGCGATVAGSFDAPVLIPVLALLTVRCWSRSAMWMKRRETSDERAISPAACGSPIRSRSESVCTISAKDWLSAARLRWVDTALGELLVGSPCKRHPGHGGAAPVVWGSQPESVALPLSRLDRGWSGDYRHVDRRVHLFGILDHDLSRVGIGAILQVIWEVGKLVSKSQSRANEPLFTWTTFGGIVAGVAMMYVTAVFIAA